MSLGQLGLRRKGGEIGSTQRARVAMGDGAGKGGLGAYLTYLFAVGGG
jgi:hypothetical protein